MENLEFSEEEIREQLAALGYKNIPRHRLHEVKQDLDVLIRSLTSPERDDTPATRAPPAVTKEKVSRASAEGFFLHQRGDGAEQQVSGQDTPLQSTRRSDSYARHSVAARPRLPRGAPSRLHVEPDSDDTLMTRDSFNSSPDAPGRRVFRRKVLRKRQGRFLVCDESVYSDDSDMYPNTRQESHQDSLNSSFWSDGESQEEEEEEVEVEVLQVVWKDPLVGHELKDATAREKPALVSKSEGSEQQSGGDQSEGEEDESEDRSEEDEGGEDDGNQGGSCGDDEEHGSEGDGGEEECYSDSSSQSSSWSGEEHGVDMEEQGSVKASAEDRHVEAPERRADMNTESEDHLSSWSDGGHQETDEPVEDLHQSVEGSSEEYVAQSSEDRKSLLSSEELHLRDDSHEVLDQAAGTITPDVPGDQSDGESGEDKHPLDLSGDETHRANEACSQKFHSTSGGMRTSLDFKSDDDDDDDDGREGESEEYDGSEDHSDEEENSQDSIFWFDQGHQDKEEEEQGENAPGDGKTVLHFQRDTCEEEEEEERGQYDGSEEESEDGDSHSAPFWSGRANENLSNTEEKMDLDSSRASQDLREVEGLSESVKEVSEEDTDMKVPEDQREEEDSFWSDDEDKKFEDAVVDEGLEEEEDEGEERSSSNLDSPAPSLMTSGYGTLLPEDQDHQRVTECDEAEDVALRSQVEAMCCGSTPPSGGDDEGAEEQDQIQDPDRLPGDEDIHFLDVGSRRSLEAGGDLGAPRQGAASSLDDRLSQLHLSERLDSEVEDDDGGGAARDSDSEENSLSAFESYVRALTRSRSDGDLRPKPKSFIRPVMVPTRKKTDPVAKYFQYKQLWDLFKVPGEKDHRELRWAVKERMAYQPPQTQTRRVHVPNAFAAPTDKKRSSLRWRVRTDLANGLVPDQHRS